MHVLHCSYVCDCQLASFPEAYPVFSVLRFVLTDAEERRGVYYCQRKLKNRKNGVGVGLGTRLPVSIIHAIFYVHMHVYMPNKEAKDVLKCATSNI